MSAELLLCPFCGSEAEEHQTNDYNDDTVIECFNQNCMARVHHDNAMLARRAWNKRTNTKEENQNSTPLAELLI